MPAGIQERVQAGRANVVRRAGRWPVLAAAAVLAGAAVLWVLWPSSPQIPGADRVRQYTNVRACLLTGAGGVAQGPAAQAWAGMEDASASTRAMVSYLPVSGPSTEAAAVPYVATLVQRQCRVIVAVGAAPVAAALRESGRFSQVRFVVAAGKAAGGNVMSITPASGSRLRAGVDAAVVAAMGQGPAA